MNKVPRLMVEVKLSDEAFSPALLLFAEKFQNQGTQAFQIVSQVSREREKNGVRLMSAARFLSELKF